MFQILLMGAAAVALDSFFEDEERKKIKKKKKKLKKRALQQAQLEDTLEISNNRAKQSAVFQQIKHEQKLLKQERKRLCQVRKNLPYQDKMRVVVHTQIEDLTMQIEHKQADADQMRL